MTDVPTVCVIGWPIKHSRSPVIHGFWLKEMGIAGAYVPVAVEPEKIREFFAGFADSGFIGGNVTVPHKEAAFAAVAEMEPSAREIGAVNTIWLEKRKLIGSNTDATGFLANLDQEAPVWDRDAGAAVVLGAGGASRAVVYALNTRGFAPIHVVNRTVSRAEGLAASFGEAVRASAWTDLPELLKRARIVVNTTTLGMPGQQHFDIDLGPLRDDAIVTDIVYIPLDTPLLVAAKRRGLKTVDGLGMLLHQAVPGFKHWFGRRPLVTPALRAAVLKTLSG